MNFYLGQRVRIRDTAIDLRGREGVIVSFIEWDNWLRSPAVELKVDGVSESVVGLHSDLEPILRTPDAAEIIAMQNLPEGPAREVVFVRSAA